MQNRTNVKTKDNVLTLVLATLSQIATDAQSQNTLRSSKLALQNISILLGFLFRNYSCELF